MSKFMCWLAVHAVAASGIRLQNYDVLKPIWYLHVPKAGSSIINTILGYVDPGFASADRSYTPPIREPHQWKQSCCDGKKTCTRFPPNQYCGNKFLSDLSYFENGHAPLPGDKKPVWEHHVLMMIREPGSRLLSGYKHDLHDCPTLQEKYRCVQDKGPAENCARASLSEYGNCVRGCTANMLSGRDCANRSNVSPVEGAAAAVDVVRNAVAFVGLTAHWPESVCLFHARFGGQCLPEEFANVRPAQETSDEPRLPASWKDDYDTPVYEAAKERFWDEIRGYKVTKEACSTRICPGVDRAIFEAAAFSKHGGRSRPPSRGKANGEHEEMEYDED